MPDAEPAEPISLEYADARAADAFAARGLVYVLGVCGLAALIKLGWSYGDMWFDWSGSVYMSGGGGSSLSDWLRYSAAAVAALGGVVALLATVLALTGSLRRGLLPILSSVLMIVAWTAQSGSTFVYYLHPPRGFVYLPSNPLVNVVASSFAYSCSDLLPYAALLWLFTRRRFATALAGGAV